MLLVTIGKLESRFVREIIGDQTVVHTNAIGEGLRAIVCPRCSHHLQCKTTPALGGSEPVPVEKLEGEPYKSFRPQKRNR